MIKPRYVVLIILVIVTSLIICSGINAKNAFRILEREALTALDSCNQDEISKLVEIAFDSRVKGGVDYKTAKRKFLINIEAFSNKCRSSLKDTALELGIRDQ